MHSSLHTSAPSWHGLTPVLQAVDMLWGTMEQAWAAIGLYMLASEDCSLWQALTASPNIAPGQRSMCHPAEGETSDAILGCKAPKLAIKSAMHARSPASRYSCDNYLPRTQVQGPKIVVQLTDTAPEYCCAMISGLVGMWSRSARRPQALR